jgi:DNA-binding transcriptional regulator YiaG
MTLREMYAGRLGLSTKEMARLLNRKPQTLRVWSTYEQGPIRPLRVNGRLFWLLADAQRLLDGQA